VRLQEGDVLSLNGDYVQKTHLRLPQHPSRPPRGRRPLPSQCSSRRRQPSLRQRPSLWRQPQRGGTHFHLPTGSARQRQVEGCG
jgi:hypothetical protein